MKKQRFSDKIRRMKHIWEMWRFIRKLLVREKIDISTLEPEQYLDIQRKGFTLEQRNIVIKETARMNGINRVLKHKPVYISLLTLVSSGGQIDDNTRKLIRSCVEAGFLNYKKDSSDYIYITNEGFKFKSFSYFLKYLIKELGVVFSFFWAIIIALTVGGLGSFIVRHSHTIICSIIHCV